MADTNSDAPLVVVFHAEEPEVLPLAEAALEQEGIEYLIRPVGARIPVVFGHPAEFGGAAGAAEVLVNADDADRARMALADLTADPEAHGSGPAPASPQAAAAAPGGPRVYRLTEAESGALIGDITARQLEFLVDELEEESDNDRDYYIDAATIDVLADAGADAELVATLRRALGSREGIEIAWAKL
jgi:processive 1,2-diacylglycerol beta-glucosyltransferase